MIDQLALASGGLTPGDAAILRFLAAAEILETDAWQQYNELGGIQDSEVPGGSARYGWAASLTRDGLERTDVLAVQSIERNMIEVQVKTVRPGNWMLGRKGTLADRSGREWYVFVKLGAPPGLPESYVVPRNHVAAATWIGHQAWLTNPEIPKGKRNTPLELARIGAEVWSGYRDGWDQLGLDARLAPVRLPMWMRDAMELERVGLPPEHPWNDRQSIPPWPEDGT